LFTPFFFFFGTHWKGSDLVHTGALDACELS
jgi:hypothetical protein